MPGASAYARLVAEQRRPGLVRHGGPLDRIELVRLATLAASSHNSQPWRFRLGRRAVAILPDFARRCPAVDPDDSHLFRSLGCAAENLVQAAGAQGHLAHAGFDAGGSQILLEFERGDSLRPGPLFHAIPARQCTRLPFDGQPVERAARVALHAAGSGPGVHTLLVDDARLRAAIAELVREGNLAQFRDAGFRRELVAWLRFDDAAALRTCDGLSSRAAARPVLPDRLLRPFARWLLSARAQARTDERNLRTSPLLAIVVAAQDAPAAWVEAGRACQRLMLQAAALDLRCAFVNQPIEVHALRPALHRVLGLHGETAQLMLRVGHGPRTPCSLRRPVLQVIEDIDRLA